MTHPDPRETAAAVGRLTGQTHITEAVTSGRMSAIEVAPLAAGMVDGLVRQVLAPLVGVQGWSGFDPEVRPCVGVVTLLDGSRLTITIGGDR